MDILEAFAKASRSVFILQVPLMGVCFMACLLIRDRGLERPKDAFEIEEERRARDGGGEVGEGNEGVKAPVERHAVDVESGVNEPKQATQGDQEKTS